MKIEKKIIKWGFVKGPVASSKIVNIYTFEYLKMFTVFQSFTVSLSVFHSS